MQRELFDRREHDEPWVVGPWWVAIGRSVVVQNCWSPDVWHVSDRRGMRRTRRGCWTALEAVFYVTAPGTWRRLDTAKAKKLMEGLVPSYYVDGGDGEVVGMAMSILLSEGYHDFSFEMLDSGGLRLHTGDITVEDRREEPARGETQRHIQLLVRAAVLAVNGGE